jgi:hypothetical protein
VRAGWMTENVAVAKTKSILIGAECDSGTYEPDSRRETSMLPVSLSISERDLQHFQIF